MMTDVKQISIPTLAEIDKRLHTNPIPIPPREVIYESWKKVQFKLDLIKLLDKRLNL